MGLSRVPPQEGFNKNVTIQSDNVTNNNGGIRILQQDILLRFSTMLYEHILR